MRINYKTYPTDYVQELNSSRGTRGRKKSRAFMEYWNDMEHGEHNSYGFYAQSWEVSKSTAHEWIKEFMHEIELFLSHWDLRNKQHYTYAQNQTERQGNETNGSKVRNYGSCEEVGERLPNEVLNNINNNTQKSFLFDKNYNDLYFVYSHNTRFVGKKQDAYDAFSRTDINIDLLKLACMKYLHDDAVDRPVGIKKFLESELYLPYLPKFMKVKGGDEWYEGIYDDVTFEFKARDGSSLGVIEPKLLVELFEKRELVYLKELSRGESL